MTDPGQLDALMVLVVGTSVLAAVLLSALFGRFGLPALVGYMLFGILLRLADSAWHVFDPRMTTVLRFLGDLGVVLLLFKVGLASHPRQLASKLPKATVIWIGDVIVSAGLGFACAHYLLGLNTVPSLVIATALTATSVGASVAVWDDKQALDSDKGEILIDVAELDDISGIALMALLFAVIPVLLSDYGNVWPVLTAEGGLFLVRFAGFFLFCMVFALYMERRLVRLAARLRPPPQRMLVVVGVGLLIAAFAGALGLSLAIGALFAGLVFSQDPEAVKTEKSFQDIYAFVMPFFFINIGFQVDPEALTQAGSISAALAAAAILGKLIGDGLPTLLMVGGPAAALIGTSMIPRAEIAMVIMHQGHQLGPDVVPASVYAAMVVVSALTCLLAPLLLAPLLERWPQKRGGG